MARLVSRSGAYHLCQWLLGHVRDGFILAFHNLSPERFIEQIEALAPNRAIDLGELVARSKDGRSTAGLFAITFDDGVGDTVRVISDPVTTPSCDS